MEAEWWSDRQMEAFSRIRPPSYETRERSEEIYDDDIPQEINEEVHAAESLKEVWEYHSLMLQIVHLIFT